MKDGKITYYYDALCGWCYGFSHVIDQLHAQYKDTLNFDVISGGLFLGRRRGPINEIAPYIKEGAYLSVESVTGVKFGNQFLSKLSSGKDMYLDSNLPAIALCIIKEKLPEEVIKFSSLLKKAIYYNGMNPVDETAYATYAEAVGYDVDEFNSKLTNPVYRNQALKEFDFFQQQPSSGFPTLTLEKEGKEYILAKGYSNFEPLNERLQELLN